MRIILPDKSKSTLKKYKPGVAKVSEKDIFLFINRFLHGLLKPYRIVQHNPDMPIISKIIEPLNTDTFLDMVGNDNKTDCLVMFYANEDCL